MPDRPRQPAYREGLFPHRVLHCVAVSGFSCEVRRHSVVGLPVAAVLRVSPPSPSPPPFPELTDQAVLSHGPLLRSACASSALLSELARMRVAWNAPQGPTIAPLLLDDSESSSSQIVHDSKPDHLPSLEAQSTCDMDAPATPRRRALLRCGSSEAPSCVQRRMGCRVLSRGEAAAQPRQTDRHS